MSGRWIDRTQRAGRSPATALAVTFLAGLPCAALLGAVSGALALSAVFFALLLVLGACAVAALASFQPLLPDRLRGAGNAGYFATVTLAGMRTGPPLFGYLSDALGGGREGPLGLALAIVIAAVALPSALLSHANRTRWASTAAAADARSAR